MKLRNALAVAAITGLAAGPFLSVAGAARPVADSTVAVFANGAYVDLDPVTVDGEVENAIDDLEGAGHVVETFTDISAAGFTAALDGADVLLIPELEQDPGLYDDMTAEARAVVADWVEAGGRLVLMDGDHAAIGLNALFGFSTVPGSGNGGDATATKDAAAAADTEFDEGPSELADISATDGLITASLPEGTTDVYLGGVVPVGTAGEGQAGPMSTVGSVPVGDGAVIYLGWDWFPDTESAADAVAATAEDEAAWAIVLDLAVSQPEVTASSPAPGALDLTMDSPSTQPVFVELVINGTTHTVVIAAKTTSASFDVGGEAAVAWSVPGWGIGEGTVEVGGATAAPPAAPAPVAPTFTG